MHDWQGREPKPGNRRCLAYDKVVDGQARLQSQFVLVATGVEQLQMHQAVGLYRPQDCQAAQVFGGDGCVGGGEARCGDQIHLGLAQTAGYQHRVFITQIPNAKGHVNTFGDQVDAAVEQDHVQLNQRILLKKAADDLRQQGMGQSHRARNTKASTGFAGHAGDGLVSHFSFQQHRLAMAQVAFSDRGQFQLPCGALQQPRAQAFFKLGDAA